MRAASTATAILDLESVLEAADDDEADILMCRISVNAVYGTFGFVLGSISYYSGGDAGEKGAVMLTCI